ncbi:MAG: HvfC family RiPP maturation protein [Gammaproteobacteria bacterium]
MTADMPEARVDFKAKQQEFADFIRNPEEHRVPADVAPERMRMYRELFFNNIDAFLADNFPVLRSLYNDREWLQLAGDFYANHACSTPYFSEIPEEFLAYLQNERDTAGDFPFMLELAHYEWVEMALAIDKAEAPPPLDAATDLSTTPLTLSPLAWPLAYRWPVHRISVDCIPEQGTFLVVYRDRDDNVKFMTLTPLTYRLLTLLQETPGATGTTLLRQLAEETGADPVSVATHGMGILREMADRTIVYTS